MMNLGVIHWAFPPREGGVESHLITVLPEMAKMGTNIFVLTETMNGEPNEKLLFGIKIIRSDGMTTSKLDELLKRNRFKE